MPVKSEVFIPVQPVPPVKFPALYQGSPSGQIVLFSSLSEGTVVKKGSGPSASEVGSFCSSWVECTDTQHWTPMPKGQGVSIIQE